MFKYIIALLVILHNADLLFAQNNPSHDPDLSVEKQEVMNVIIELFDGYRAGDSSRVRAVFTNDALLKRATVKDGKPFLGGGSVDGFVKYIGAGLDKLHDEPIWDYSVYVDGTLASVWAKYAFYLGGQFHHCGSESFQLFKQDNGWKIFLLVDTSKEECTIPDYIRKKSEKN